MHPILLLVQEVKLFQDALVSDRSKPASLSWRIISGSLKFSPRFLSLALMMSRFNRLTNSLLIFHALTISSLGRVGICLSISSRERSLIWNTPSSWGGWGLWGL